MRAYQGYGPLNTQLATGWTTYHSLQLSLNRRFTHGFSVGLNDTIGLDSGGNSAPRLQHNPDGSYQLRSDQAEADKLLLAKPLRHTIKGNFVWDLPDLRASDGPMRVVGLVISDWQVSGIVSAASGPSYTVGVTYSGNSSPNVNLTGSPDYAARVRVVGDPGLGCSDDLLRQFKTDVFLGPQSGSVGLESGANTLQGCFTTTVDLSIARTIMLPAKKSIQFRVDAFNALNSAAVTGRNATMQLSSLDPAVATITNLPFDANGNVIASRSQPKNAGFGVATGFQAARTVQVQLRLQF
jgi:hypothetical protein